MEETDIQEEKEPDNLDNKAIILIDTICIPKRCHKCNRKLYNMNNYVNQTILTNQFCLDCSRGHLYCYCNICRKVSSIDSCLNKFVYKIRHKHATHVF